MNKKYLLLIIPLIVLIGSIYFYLNRNVYVDTNNKFLIFLPPATKVTENKIIPIKSECPEVKDFWNKDCVDTEIEITVHNKTTIQNLIDTDTNDPYISSYEKKPEIIIASYMGMYSHWKVYIPLKSESILELDFFAIDSEEMFKILNKVYYLN